jgi:hypothetical protein
VTLYYVEPAALQAIRRIGLLDALIETARTVYPRVSDGHNEERGHDGHTFGVLIWREFEFELASRIESLPGICVERPSGSFCVRFENYRLFLKKFGAAESFDVERIRWEDDSGLRFQVATQNVRDMQLSLAVEDDELVIAAEEARLTPIDAASALMLAHTGDPYTADFELHLGTPQISADSDSPWLWRETVFRSGSDEPASENEQRSRQASFRDLEAPEPEMEVMPDPMTRLHDVPDEVQTSNEGSDGNRA